MVPETVEVDELVDVEGVLPLPAAGVSDFDDEQAVVARTTAEPMASRERADRRICNS
jgi:hypothetical protein